MKKILYTLFAMFAISTYANASEYDIFIGADVGLSSAEFSDTTGSYENNEMTTYGLKVGAVGDRARVYLSYQYMDAFEGSSSREGAFHAATINTEGFSEAYSMIDSIDHTFFIGAHLGAINLDLDADFVPVAINTFGALYGVQAGVITSFGSVVSVELGYRLSFSNFSDDDINLDELHAFYGGLNLRF